MKNINRISAALAALTGAIALAGCSGAQKVEAPTKVAALDEVSTQSAQTATASETAKKSGPQIQWASSFEAARDEAKKRNKPLMVDFYADWCSACKMLDADIYPDAAVVKASRDFINVKVNTEQRTDIAGQYGVTALPTILWIRADGTPVLRQEGITTQPSDFADQMKKATARYAAVKK